MRLETMYKKRENNDCWRPARSLAHFIDPGEKRERKKGERDSLAVQTAKRSCIESKKKNMTSRETEAPSGRQSACMVSSV